MRRRVQMIFQDPFASLNPRLKAGPIVGEPLENHGLAPAKGRGTRRCAISFARVGLRREARRSFRTNSPAASASASASHARLRWSPTSSSADEPVSALDVSVQAQVLNLLVDLQRELGLAYLFISHDLGVVEHIAHRVAVMYLGRSSRSATGRTIFAAPRHPYTQALLAAAPVADPLGKA